MLVPGYTFDLGIFPVNVEGFSKMRFNHHCFFRKFGTISNLFTETVKKRLKWDCMLLKSRIGKWSPTSGMGKIGQFKWGAISAPVIVTSTEASVFLLLNKVGVPSFNITKFLSSAKYSHIRLLEELTEDIKHYAN